jgi:nucleoid-associated protein YgaU
MAPKYQVAVGDTFHTLARRFYRDPDMAAALAAANHQPVTAELIVGQELVIPYITQRHTVSSGDTLRGLAERLYGDAALYPVLAAANHIAEACPGDRLLVPDLENVSRHTVFPGDTLAEFAVRWYNDEQCRTVIEYANSLAGQQHIEIGQELIRPGLNCRHVVEDGETWSQLAQWWYGDPTLDHLIAAANHRSDDEAPPVGQVLFFPDLADF